MKKIHLLTTLILITLLLATLLIGVTGCNKDVVPEKEIGIISISIDAATGNRENNNCIRLFNDYAEFDHFNEEKYKLMTSDTAIKLIDEINKLPDVLGSEEAPFAYSIRLEYYDENKQSAKTEKIGYGEFPDNWSTIISCTNEISTLKQKITDSTDIVIIDADLLRSEFGFSDDMLPEGVTVEKLLEDTPLTYVELYKYKSFDVKRHIRDYKYDYYDMKSHKITEETQASPSDGSSLKEYAASVLDNITSTGDTCITGNFENYEFEIVRFDCFEDWRNTDDTCGLSINPDDTVDIFYDIDLHMEGMHTNEIHYVFVDPSNRFLIITRCEEYDVIKDFLEK